MHVDCVSCGRSVNYNDSVAVFEVSPGRYHYNCQTCAADLGAVDVRTNGMEHPEDTQISDDDDLNSDDIDSVLNSPEYIKSCMHADDVDLYRD